MERRVDQPDDDRQAVHRPEDALEVALLEDLELGHRGIEGADRLGLVGAQLLAGSDLGLGPRRRRWRRGSRPHDLEPLALTEHVLGAAQADALRAVARGPGRPPRACRHWSRRPCAGSRRPSPGRLELGLVLEAGRDRRQRADETSPVEPSRLIQSPSLKLVPVGRGRVSARSPRSAPRSPRRMACRSGARRPPRGRSRRLARSGCPPRRPCRGIIGRGLDADEDDLLAAADPLDRDIGVEDGPPDGRAR